MKISFLGCAAIACAATAYAGQTATNPTSSTPATSPTGTAGTAGTAGATGTTGTGAAGTVSGTARANRRDLCADQRDGAGRIRDGHDWFARERDAGISCHQHSSGRRPLPAVRP